jgi:hypothetical protein
MGRCLLPDGMTDQRYHEVLETSLPRLLEDVPLAVRQRWFQHDRAPAHYGEVIQQRLNATYPGSWIGRSGPIVWPHRLSDLTPVDFFMWGRPREHVYAVLVRSVEDLVARIQAAVITVDANM